MTKMVKNLFLQVGLLMMFYIALGCAISIGIQPNVVSTNTKTPVKLSCIPNQDIEDYADAIILIKLTKGSETIVTVRDPSSLEYGKGMETKFKAEGLVDKIPSQSYLRTTLLNPSEEDTGNYECKMYYLDRSSTAKQELDSGSLTVHSITDGKGNEEIPLEVKVQSLQAQLDRQFKNEEDRPIFSAKYTFRKALKTGDTIVFNEVLVSEGLAGYDKGTGIFTVPKSGIYNFQLSAAMGKSDGFINIDIVVDGKVQAGLTAADKAFDDQSSMSFLIRLVEGSKVKAVLRARSSPLITLNSANDWTLFSGFLVKE